MPNPLESQSGSENPALQKAPASHDGPSLEDLEAEARLLWEEDPELAAALGIELTGLAGSQKKNGAQGASNVAPKKTAPVEKPEAGKAGKKSAKKKR